MRPLGKWLAWLVAGLVVLGWTRLRFETDILALLPADLPVVRALERHQHHFASAQDLIITLRGDDPDVVASAAQTLAQSLRQAPHLVRRAVWTPPWEERPDLGAELAATAWLNAPPDSINGLAKRLDPANLPAHLASVRERLATSLSAVEVARGGYDPLGLGEISGSQGSSEGADFRFSSDDGLFRILLVTPASSRSGYDVSIEWLKALRTEIERWQAASPEASNIRWRWTGGPAIAAEIASGMERDMRGSVGGTVLIIAVLFGWAHRRWRPLAGILVLLVLILALTLGFGGLVFGRINAVSLGFAAILLGLAVDYGLILYQEALTLRSAEPARVRRHAGPGVLWSAITTAAAFATLPFSGVPGLTQLGVLVAIGMLFAAAVMLRWAMPPWLPIPDSQPEGRGTLRRASSTHEATPPIPTNPTPSPRTNSWPGRGLSMVLLVIALFILARHGFPSLDHSATPLRPTHSDAYAALDEMRHQIGSGETDPWWIIAEGAHESEVAAKLQRADRILQQSQERGQIASWQLPSALWPVPDHQQSNAARLATIATERGRLLQNLEQQGFSADAFRFADAVLDTWSRAHSSVGVFWPTNAVSDWVLSQAAARQPGHFLALGLLRPSPGTNAVEVATALRNADLLVGGWDLLGEELLNRVKHRIGWVIGAMGLVWTISLLWAFRSILASCMAMMSMALAGVLLLGWMALAGWQWNLMNLVALPLLVGTGTDYSIHILLALQRHHGNFAAVRHNVGRALFLCAATTIAGFGSLAWSANAGLASLGSVCAAGLACAYLSACWLLPSWWKPRSSRTEPQPSAPSRLYQGAAWRLGLFIARHCPRGLLTVLAAAAGRLYASLVPARRRVVEQNLLPILDHNAALARRTAWRLFGQFGRKIADLWTYEAGKPVHHAFTEFHGWEHLTRAREQGGGILLLTPHLGNWEFGAPLLAHRNIPLVVITLAEPGAGFTELRQEARARWGIETLVIGQDPFAFVEVIKRLQSGAVVALLVDRPPPGTATPVELFGHPFSASVAGAELARATGCHLLPVLLPATPRGYAAHVLPPIPYDRQALGNRAARRALTQDILRAFEPYLRQYADQWFHFVPVWPPPSESSPSA